VVLAGKSAETLADKVGGHLKSYLDDCQELAMYLSTSVAYKT